MSLRGFEVEVIPPIGRVYLAAREAKDKYLKFSRADVTDEMLAPVIEIRARNTNKDMKTTSMWNTSWYSLVAAKRVQFNPQRWRTGTARPRT